MIFRSCVLVLLFISASPAFADISVGDQYAGSSGTITVTEIQTCPNVQVMSLVSSNLELMMARLSCSQKSEIEGFLKVTEITTNIISVAAACTPVGAPVVVGAGIAGVANQMISLVVSNLDCDDTSSDQKIDRLVKTSVCEALNRQGLICDLDE